MQIVIRYEIKIQKNKDMVNIANYWIFSFVNAIKEYKEKPLRAVARGSTGGTDLCPRDHFYQEIAKLPQNNHFKDYKLNNRTKYEPTIR